MFDTHGLIGFRNRWRRWRLSVWRKRLHVAETKLELFQEHPWETNFASPNMLVKRLSNDVNTCRYTVGLLERLLGIEGPRALSLVDKDVAQSVEKMAPKSLA